MKEYIHYLVIFILCCLIPIGAQATIFNAVSNGYWHDSATWDQPGTPGPTDTVSIDGFEVTYCQVSGMSSISYLIITNVTNSNTSMLRVQSDGTLSQLRVTGDMIMTNNDLVNQDVWLIVEGGATLSVDGTLNCTRTTNNASTSQLTVNVKDSSSLAIGGNFLFSYLNSNASEITDEILLADAANLSIGGDLNILVASGASFSLNARDSSVVDIGGDLIANLNGGVGLNILISESADATLNNLFLTNAGGSGVALVQLDAHDAVLNAKQDIFLTSNAVNRLVELEIDDDTQLDADGNIVLDAFSEGDVLVDIRAGSIVNLKGQFSRPSNFGALAMDATSTLNYSGTSAQTIPSAKLTGGGSDAFVFSNVQVNNQEGVTLGDTLIITKSLNLTDGNLNTDDTNILILEDNATVIGYDNDHYVNGPMIKRGRSSGAPFIFPIGNSDSYAPIEVSTISNVATEIKASFEGDPPPWGSDLGTGIDNIATDYYWTLAKNAGTDNLVVTLHWTADIAGGITSLSDLIVARLNETSGSEEWENYGNDGTTGNFLSGTVQSSASSLLGDPPPWGNETFTIGSTTPLNALPIELVNFQAVQDNQSVLMQWETASEINASHFEIQRSYNGRDFQTIGGVICKGGPDFGQTYHYYDRELLSGVIYYRLKMVDEDDSFEYSSIEAVRFDSSPGIEVAPNPVHERINIRSNEFNTGSTPIEIFDQYGRLMYAGVIEFENGQAQLEAASVNIFDSGTYYIRMQKDLRSFTVKFIKMY